MDVISLLMLLGLPNRPYNDPITQNMLNALDADLETRLREGRG